MCNRESDHLSNMRSHVELHIQINRSCDECGKTFNTKAPVNHQNTDIIELKTVPFQLIGQKSKFQNSLCFCCWLLVVVRIH